MALEAQEIAVRLRLLNGTAFNTEAKAAAAGIAEIGAAAKKVNTEQVVANDAGLLGFLGKTNKSLDAATGKLDKLSKKSLQVGRETAVLSAGAGFLIFESIKEAAAVEGKFRLLETQAHATMKQRHELEKDVKGLSSLGGSPQEEADALYELMSTYHSVPKAMEGLKVSLKGAAIGHDTVTAAASAMISTMKSGFKDVHNFREAMALLDETVGSGKIHLPELTSAFHGSFFPTAASVGMPFRDALGILAAASQTGQSPEEVGTRARTMILKMKNLKGAALGAAKILGFDANTMQDELRESGGFAKILAQIHAKEGVLGKDVTSSAISQLFGGSRSAGTVFTSLTTEAAYKEIVNGWLKNTKSSTLDLHFKQQEHTLEYQKKVLRGEIREALNEIGKAFGPPVIAAMKEFAGDAKELAGTFGELPGPVKSVIGGLLVFTALLAPVAFIFAGLSAGGSLAFGGLGILTGGILKLLGPAGNADTALLKVTNGVGRLAPALGILGAAVLALYWTMEKGKHPFNAWEEAFHNVFGGHTAKEEEEKTRTATEDRHFLHKVHGQERHRLEKLEQITNPWSRHIKDPKLKAEVEGAERTANRAGRQAGSLVEHFAKEIVIDLHLDGQKVGESRHVVNGIERKQREHQNRR